MSAWQDSARCAEVDPELFFPELGDHQDALDAKRVCASCPVRFECLTQALQRREQYGVWGGMSVVERRAVTRLPHRCRQCSGPVLEAGHRYCGPDCQRTARAVRRRERQHVEWAA
ncbi:WhiB family transcriptional regulator [Nonomuraea sp. NPDC050556]|uniref:WhiB family transcriptional regulator n=1 Tax=Nonomuraea sp. NPDC050556 TaxID=3364369 RepID=UPI00378E39DE